MTDPRRVWQPEDLRGEHFKPKWVLNGFPKAGLHWVVLLLSTFAKPHNDGHEVFSMPWCGTFSDHSWTLNRHSVEKVAYKFGRLRDGEFYKSHLGHSQELERFLWYLGVSHVFIYRDPRDVAVSQAHHVLNEDDVHLMHPNKQVYLNMGSFEEVLRAVIEGVDQYVGVMERWEQYAPWLDVGWVLKIRFEDLKADTQEVCRQLLRYGMERTSGIFELTPQFIEEKIEEVSGAMVEMGQRTDQSVTFRKGEVGGWREAFTPALVEVFKATDKNGWLKKLGYAW